MKVIGSTGAAFFAVLLCGTASAQLDKLVDKGKDLFGSDDAQPQAEENQQSASGAEAGPIDECEIVGSHPFSDLSVAGIRPGMYFECAYQAVDGEFFLELVDDGWEYEDGDRSNIRGCHPQLDRWVEQEWLSGCDISGSFSGTIGLARDVYHHVVLEIEPSDLDGSIEAIVFTKRYTGFENQQQCEAAADNFLSVISNPYTLEDAYSNGVMSASSDGFLLRMRMADCASMSFPEAPARFSLILMED